MLNYYVTMTVLVQYKTSTKITRGNVLINTALCFILKTFFTDLPPWIFARASIGEFYAVSRTQTSLMPKKVLAASLGS